MKIQRKSHLYTGLLLLVIGLYLSFIIVTDWRQGREDIASAASMDAVVTREGYTSCRSEPVSSKSSTLIDICEVLVMVNVQHPRWAGQLTVTDEVRGLDQARAIAARHTVGTPLKVYKITRGNTSHVISEGEYARRVEMSHPVQLAYLLLGLPFMIGGGACIFFSTVGS